MFLPSFMEGALLIARGIYIYIYIYIYLSISVYRIPFIHSSNVTLIVNPIPYSCEYEI